jgi:hypothetical protein
MTAFGWEEASWIATAIGLPLAAIGLAFSAYVLRKQAQASRRDALAALYAELDTPEARIARNAIYDARPETLTYDYLHDKENEEDRRRVEEMLAALERMAYPIARKQLPPNDAFALYGGVLLRLTRSLWPYIEARRKRAKPPDPGYRRFLEQVARDWAVRYKQSPAGSEMREGRPVGDPPTAEVLGSLRFPGDEESASESSAAV